MAVLQQLNLRHRPQFDIDLFFPKDSILRARDVLVRTLGYEPAGTHHPGPIDHLPTMIRKTGWRWRAIYSDPEFPPSIELHFRFWDPETERFDIEGTEDFWSRRTIRRTKGLALPALSLVDGLAYTFDLISPSILRGNVRAYHVYELAHFIEHSTQSRTFWTQWRSGTRPALKTMQAIAFRFAAEWFECDGAPEVNEAIASLEGPVADWFDLFALSPAKAMEAPNKDELWLHLELLTSKRDRMAVAARRVFPARSPKVCLDVHVPGAANPRLRIRRIGFQLCIPCFTHVAPCAHFRSSRGRRTPLGFSACPPSSSWPDSSLLRTSPPCRKPRAESAESKIARSRPAVPPGNSRGLRGIGDE